MNDNFVFAVFFICLANLLMMACVCTTVYNLSAYKIEVANKVEKKANE